MSGYLLLNGDDVADAVERMHKVVQAEGLKPDILVCTGLSGMSVTPWLASKMGIGYAVVRKQGETSHSGEVSLTSTWDIKGRDLDYMWVDDLIDSGATYRWVRDQVKDCAVMWDMTSILLFRPHMGSTAGCGEWYDPQHKVPIYFAGSESSNRYANEYRASWRKTHHDMKEKA